MQHVMEGTHHVSEVEELKTELMETQAENKQTQLVMEWGWRVFLTLVTVAMAYFQMQTSLSIAQLELKIERQRVEDIQNRPNQKDIDRLERQMHEMNEQIMGIQNANRK